MHERKQFGERLATARDNAKMTQTDVAAIFDIKKAAVSAWERGRNMPTVDRITPAGTEPAFFSPAGLFCVDRTVNGA